MPRTNSSSPECKPYDKKPQTKAKTKTKTRSGPPPQPWTNTEYSSLLNHVLSHGRTKWEEAVAGRTANQCRQTWTMTLEPFIKTAVATKSAASPRKVKTKSEM